MNLFVTIAAEVITKSTFIELPASAKSLYLYLNMYADTDGFLSEYKHIPGYSEADFNMLTDNGFIIAFNSGVIAITDYHHNNIIADEIWDYTPTVHQYERSKLELREDGRYYLLKDAKGSVE